MNDPWREIIGVVGDVSPTTAPIRNCADNRILAGHDE